MTLRNLVPFFGKARAPVRYEYRPIDMFSRDFDSLFEDFFSRLDLDPFRSGYKEFKPDVEVNDGERELTVAAELPGMEGKDIDLSLKDNTLTISGEKREEKETDGKGYSMKERSYGTFRRVIPLYHEIDGDKVKASYKKGVLKIHLPKSKHELESSKKVHVKVE